METETLYRQRRAAAAALWRSVPPEQFDMRGWGCGTTACALGWLANDRHNGWKWRSIIGQSSIIGRNRRSLWPAWSNPSFKPIIDVFDRNTPYSHAATYFGLSDADAYGCFRGEGAMHHDRTGRKDVTLSDVGDTLLSLPIILRSE